MANLNDFTIGDKVRFIDKRSPDWYGQEGVVIRLDDAFSHVHYEVTKPSPGHEDKYYNRIGRVTYIQPHRLEIIEKHSKFKVGDRVKIVKYGHFPQSNKIGATATVVRLTGLNHPHIELKVDEEHCRAVTANSALRLYVAGDEIVLLKDEKPEAPFKVGDTVYLTRKGIKKDGLPALKNRLKATVTRAHWYWKSKEWGYYLDIPGVTDNEDLAWMKSYEFYEGEFESKKSLKKASVKRLQKEKLGAVITDSEDDKWVYVGKNTWVVTLEEKDTIELTTEQLVEEYGPISLI